MEPIIFGQLIWVPGFRYTSTQDAVVALEALTSYAELLGTNNESLEISISFGDKTIDFSAVNSITADLLQIKSLHELADPTSFKEVEMTSRGSGSAQCIEMLIVMLKQHFI